MAKGFDTPQNVIERLIKEYPFQYQDMVDTSQNVIKRLNVIEQRLNVIEKLIAKTEGIDMEKEKSMPNVKNMQSNPTQNNQATLDIIEQIYPIAKDVFNGKYDITTAVNRIVEETGMNRGSARNLVTAFKNMMTGELYTAKISGVATRYALEQIDPNTAAGQEELGRALSSVKQHIEYQQGHGTQSHNIRAIHSEFSELLTDNEGK